MRVDHIIFDVDFRHGRFVRKPGEICCELFRQKALTSLKPVGESEWHYRSCPKCVRYASQYGVPLPHQPEIPDGTAMIKVLVSAPDSVDRPFVTRDPDAAGSYMKEEMFAITFPEQYLEQYLGHYKSQDWFAFTGASLQSTYHQLDYKQL